MYTYTYFDLWVILKTFILFTFIKIARIFKNGFMTI